MEISARPKAIHSKADFWTFIAGLIVFSVAFGYVEAAVVAYLRSIYTPLRAHFYSVTPDELFPLLSLEQLRTLGPEHVARLKIELGRELATLLMLAGAAMIAARTLRVWVAAFLVCFGLWDVTFYLFLKMLIDWPASLQTWDILFLLPVPWAGPVIAPVIVSLSMIGSGLLLLWREYNNKRVHITGLQASVIVLGGMLIVAAFMWDFRNTASGGNPNPFNWALFTAGEAIGLLAFLSTLQSRYNIPQVSHLESRTP
jgi:hypothetical protein